MPDRVPAGHHGLLGGAVVFFGLNPKTGRRFVVQSLEGGGWGGRPHEDGESGSVSICQGDVRNGTLEGIELKTPVLVEGRTLRTDSGGPGKFRGGLGITRSYRLLNRTGTLVSYSIASKRDDTGPVLPGFLLLLAKLAFWNYLPTRRHASFYNVWASAVTMVSTTVGIMPDQFAIPAG